MAKQIEQSGDAQHPVAYKAEEVARDAFLFIASSDVRGEPTGYTIRTTAANVCGDARAGAGGGL
jgi:hypothetical protein